MTSHTYGITKARKSLTCANVLKSVDQYLNVFFATTNESDINSQKLS